MNALIRVLPALANLVPNLLPWLLDLATWLLARLLNMPEPLVQAAGLFVFVRVQAFETSVGKSLCPVALLRRLLGSWRHAP
jgi:hypothetical protein